MKTHATVMVSQKLIKPILEDAKLLYPRETILLLRGKKSRDAFYIEELVVPPLATYGHGFATVPLHMLPMDFSIIGTVHSHPSGNLAPSDADFNHFFGRVLMIVGFPFASAENVAVYDPRGEKLPLHLIKG